MKSETLSKIKKSREKYFQELREKRAEKIRQAEGKESGESPSAEDRTEKTGSNKRSSSASMEDALSSSLNRAQNELKKISAMVPEWFPSPGTNARILMAQVRHPLTRAGRFIGHKRERIRSVMNERTGKAIDRFNSYMMVIFDA